MTQIGPYKDQDGARWTTAQAAHIQHVVDNFTFDFDLMNGDCIIEFVRTLGTKNGNTVWGQRFGGRVLKIRKDLSQNETRYTIPHETGHQVIVDLLNNAAKTALQPLLLPHGQYGLTAADWKDGPYNWMASECFCDDFAKVYAGAGASWKNVLEGSNPPSSRFYKRSFTDISAAKSIIESGGPGDPDDDDDGDPFFPVAISFDALKDQSRRHKKSGGTNQASGKEKHLPLGFLDLPDGANDWVYDALLKFDIAWPEDMAKVWNADLELTVIHGPAEHISGSGDKSVLQAKRVTHDWPEGDNPEGEWNASDYESPSTATNVASLGAVGSQTTGTRMSFPVLDFIKKWAPASVNVVDRGVGEHEANNGMLLSVSRIDKIDGATMFASREYTTNADRPKLYLEYTPTSAKPVCMLTYPAGSINTNIFEFMGEYSDPFANDEMQAVELEVKRGSTTIWQPGVRQVGANEIALGIFSTDSLAQGAPTWVAGQSYAFRAKVQSATSNKWSDWTDWLDFTISNVAPTVSATSLGSKVTLAGVYFGGPFTGPTQPPPPNPTGPLGFARMTMFHWQNWANTSDHPDSEIHASIDQMVEMHQRGVILESIDWNSPRYNIRSNTDDVLGWFIDAGITPYLGLWLKEFGTAVGENNFNEVQRSLDAWAAGAGQWGGVIVDIEDAWSDFHRDHHGQVNSNLDGWISAMRGVVGGKFLAYTSYGVPSFHMNMGWDHLDARFDLFLPHVFYSGENGDGPGDTMENINRTKRDIANMGMVKPYIMVANAYGSGANPANRLEFANWNLEHVGSVGWWRYPIRNSEVRDAFHSIRRDAPESG